MTKVRVNGMDLEGSLPEIVAIIQALRPAAVVASKATRINKQCPMCPKVFKFASGFKSHMNSFHKQNGYLKKHKKHQYTKQCPNCPKRCKGRMGLGIHISKRHPELSKGGNGASLTQEELV